MNYNGDIELNNEDLKDGFDNNKDLDDEDSDDDGIINKIKPKKDESLERKSVKIGA